jgi:2-C-methyl-D-erythritol 4-phosphate cytidylyltransferase
VENPRTGVLSRPPILVVVSVWVIVVAAGSGTRFGGPKQFEPLGDKRVVDWSLDLARSIGNGTIIVTNDGVDRDFGVDAVVTGGPTRSASVRAGLALVPDDATVILVHDAARPLATKTLWNSVVDAVCGGAAAAIPGVPVVDTIKRVTSNGKVLETVDRSELVSVQTPQGFEASALRRAHALEPDATDDAGLVEALGGTVVTVPGESRNFKITVPDDLVYARALVAR